MRHGLLIGLSPLCGFQAYGNTVFSMTLNITCWCIYITPATHHIPATSQLLLTTSQPPTTNQPPTTCHPPASYYSPLVSHPPPARHPPHDIHQSSTRHMPRATSQSLTTYQPPATSHQPPAPLSTLQTGWTNKLSARLPFWETGEFKAWSSETNNLIINTFHFLARHSALS